MDIRNSAADRTEYPPPVLLMKRWLTTSEQNVTFIGAHDSAFSATDVFILSADQHYNVTKQLDDGIRLLQSQGHNFSGTIELCHTNCIL
jgi:hypothetical protein